MSTGRTIGAGTLGIADNTVTAAKLAGDVNAAAVGAAESSHTHAAGDVTGLAAVATSGSAADLGSGILPDARMPNLTGDVTTSEGAVATTIANGIVSLAKMADLAQDKIVGRATASTGVPEAITCTAAGRALLDDADNATQRTTLGLAAVASSGSASDLSAGTLAVARGGTGVASLTAIAEAIGIYRSVLASDAGSNSTTTPTEITALSKTLPAGTYQITLMIRYQAAATTTGVRIGLNFTGTTTSLVWNVRFVDASATAATATPDQDNIGAAAAVFSVFAHRAGKTTANTGTTLGVDTQNADMYAVIDALLVCSGSGDLELWHGSEVAFASTIKAGTSLLAVKMD
jgi:hypothetical protein